MDRHSAGRKRVIGFNGLYDWKNALELEGHDWRDNLPVRLISAHRSRKGWGRVPARLWTVTASGWPPQHLPAGLDEWARPFRRHHYYPARSIDEIMIGVVTGSDVQVRVPLTSQWESAYLGVIEVPTGAMPLDGREHAIMLTHYDRERRTFRFPNSWGDSWGNLGWGEIPVDYVRHYSEPWVSPPLTSDLFWSKLLPRELRSAFGLHPDGLRAELGDDAVVRLIEDAQIDVRERRRQFAEVRTRLKTVWGSPMFVVEWWDLAENADVAWSFCLDRGRWLEVEEFFVMPRYRGEGYARRMAVTLRDHAAAVGVSLTKILPRGRRKSVEKLASFETAGVHARPARGQPPHASGRRARRRRACASG